MILGGLKDLPARPLTGQSVTLLFLLCVRMCFLFLPCTYFLTHGLLAVHARHSSGVCVFVLVYDTCNF